MHFLAPTISSCIINIMSLFHNTCFVPATQKTILNYSSFCNVQYFFTNLVPTNISIKCRITNDDREEEMEENMQQVSTMIGNLRNMAQDMGTEVSNQNSQLDRINLKGASNESRVKMANDRAGRLLK